MKTHFKTFATRSLVHALAWCLALQPAFAQVSISQTPLATSGGNSILANLMFILDDSGSMDGTQLPVHAGGAQQCMTVSGSSTFCSQGDPPYDTGGLNGSNGVAYDPNFHYKPALTYNGNNVLGSIDPVAVPNDAFGVQSNNETNLTTGIDTDNDSKVVDRRYCNRSSGSGGICKRNGMNAAGTALVSGNDAYGNAMSAGRFPYRTHPSNSSTPVFGLPEMMSIGSFARASTTVTATTLHAHGLTTSDRVYVVGTGDSGLNVNCAAVTAATTGAPFTFTYATASGSGTINAKTGSFRMCVSGTFVRNTGGTFVGPPTDFARVTSTGHGLVSGDRITTFNVAGTNMNQADRPVTVIDADSFTYDTDNSGGQADTTGQWVRTGLYNVRESVSPTPPPAYSIVPVEHCSDDSLSNCIASATPSAGFTVPAYVRYCQTQELALAPVEIGDASGTPRCRSKYVNSGPTLWQFGRYGLFQRSSIQSGLAPFVRSAARADCLGAPNCTYDEEIQNYARWYTYYRTRMQMMKTAAGRAFQSFVSSPPDIPDKLRVGFITINPYSPNDGSLHGSVSDPVAKYLRVAPFDQVHAQAWYTKFYAQRPGPYTPLRESLARVGWIFAGKMDASPLTDNIPAADDPVEAACQRNFALLTTDGYWNGENGLDLAGNPIGNVDNVNPTIDAPYTVPSVDRTTTGTFDGAVGAVVLSTKTPSQRREQVICRGNLTTAFSPTEQTACPCTARQHAVMERIYQETLTVETTDGVETLNENVVDPIDFAQVAPGCVEGAWEERSQAKNTVQIRRCVDGGSSNTGPVSFWDGSSKQCASYCSSSKRRVLIRLTRPATQLLTTVDGIQTEVGPLTAAGPPAYEWSNNGSTWNVTEPATDSGCTSSTLSGYDQSNPTTTNNGASTFVASAAGTALSITLSPNPTPLTPGTPLVENRTGYPDTLADVAMYYFRTDLRGGTDFRGSATGPATSPNANPPGGDVSANVVPAKAGARNFATHQHMVTFGVGMVDGLMRYQPDYESATSGDYFNIRNGTADGCFWVTGTCNWPQPSSGATTALDDLWHASVNGRGNFFLAKDVDALQAGIQGTLNAVNAQVAAAAASATSSPNITQTNNQIFSTTYETITWSGKVFAQTIDPNTGNVNPAIQWQADQQLICSGSCAGTAGKAGTNTDTRSIYTFDETATGTLLKPFLWGSLTDEVALFTNKCSGASPWQQCSGLTGTDLDKANDGSSLVAFLRGQTENEGLNPPIFRDRTFIDPVTNSVTQTVLGDTISAKPSYLREATFNYGGTYALYRTAKAGRAPRVFVGANDGFLHAFDGDTGQEAWAYTPRFLMPGLFQLADTAYTSSSNHRYFADGSPETGDVCSTAACAASTDWRTILVAGVNGGGQGFFALDVSHADTGTPGDDPKGLWEFCADAALCAVSDPDLGLSFGNPVIGKRSHDGRWVVVVTSGLNNGTASGGDGKGYFYVLDAITGEILNKVGTGEGTPGSPSGLMKISGFFDNALTDPTFRYVYGGDQLGNVFRLDLGAPVLPADVEDPAPTAVIKLATLKDADGRLQPVTTRPALTHIGAKNILYIGTGRYLGTPDLSDQGAGPAWQHTLYAFSDKGAPYTASSLRDSPGMKVRTLTAISPTERGMEDVAAGAEVDWTANEAGWFVDFNPSLGSPPTPASPGEGVNIVDPRLVLGTLVVATNAPAAGGSCSVGGSSFFYNFDFREGTAVSSSPNGVVGISLGGTITVGVAVVQLPSGAIKAISTGADTTKTTSGVSIGASGSSVKRFSYRLR